MRISILGFCLLTAVIIVNNSCSYKEPAPKKLSKVYVNTLPPSYHIYFTKFRKLHSNGLLLVEVVVENLSDRKYDDIEYCFKWYDRRFHEIGEEFSIWQPLFLNAKDTKKIKVLAPLPLVKRYKFLVRKRAR